MSLIHVTRISAAFDVYGHDESHCDESGCTGNELYFESLNARAETGKFNTGDLVDEDQK